MIKGRITINDSPAMVLGLTGENVARLAAGEPIAFEGQELGFPDIRVVVIYGQDNDAIITELSKYFNFTVYETGQRT